MKIYSVLRVCYHFYFILQEAGVRTGVHDMMSCLEMPGSTNVLNLQIILLKIILEVLKIDFFEG